MLELLLRSRLEDLQIPGDQLTVVVGGRSAPALAVLVNQIAPSIHLRRVAGNGSSGPMHSLGPQLHLSSCRTSTLQPWVGSGYLEPDGEQGWRPRILARAQPTHWQTSAASGLPKQPGLERLGILGAATG